MLEERGLDTRAVCVARCKSGPSQPRQDQFLTLGFRVRSPLVPCSLGNSVILSRRRRIGSADASAGDYTIIIVIRRVLTRRKLQQSRSFALRAQDDTPAFVALSKTPTPSWATATQEPL